MASSTSSLSGCITGRSARACCALPPGAAAGGAPPRPTSASRPRPRLRARRQRSDLAAGQCHLVAGGGGALGSRACRRRSWHSSKLAQPACRRRAGARVHVGWLEAPGRSHQAGARCGRRGGAVAAARRAPLLPGGLDNGHHRKELRKLALSEQAAGRGHDLHIRDVSSSFHRWSWPTATSPTRSAASCAVPSEAQSQQQRRRRQWQQRR